MDNRERLENYAAGAATRYWCSLLRQVRAGKDLASQHQWRFDLPGDFRTS